MTLKCTIKTIFFSLAFISIFSIKAGATIFTVNVANVNFSPVDIPNVLLGDTLRWVWVNGFHTTTSTSVPPGAVTWDAPITEANPTFEYVVTVAGVYNYWCKPHQPTMAATFTASAPLPVKLSEFKIANENNSAVLNWITESEENIDYFSVQKSKTGTGFTEIARVPAAGNSSVTKSYKYTDPASASSSDKYYYYTIAIVDKEGKRELSNVELFKNKLNISKIVMSISPNPIDRSGHLMLKFSADKTSKMEVKVVNIEGRSVLETTMQAYEGVNNGHLMLGKNITAGSYSLIFELNGVKEVHKLLVK